MELLYPSEFSCDDDDEINLITFLLFFYIIDRVERSSDQVIKPVNLEALTKWVGNIPEDVVHDMANIAPMLSILGKLLPTFLTPSMLICIVYSQATTLILIRPTTGMLMTSLRRILIR